MAEHSQKKIKLNQVNPKELFEQKFKECVSGYHLINEPCIKETIWEEINTTVFLYSGVEIYSKSNGSHNSGMDINCSFGRISNKSAVYSSADKNGFDVSSYRLTTICSDKNCGTQTDIIQEINKRKNFDYYSIIVRNECSETNEITYDWLLIPSDYSAFDPNFYEWSPMIGKKGKNKGTQVGWTTNIINGSKMTITFSMSSQLWIKIQMTDELKEFIVASATVKHSPKYSYIDIYERLSSSDANLSLATSM